MKFGIFAALASPYASPETITAVGVHAEERGIDSIWVPEHVVLFDQYESSYPYSADGRIPAPPGSGMLEPFTLLAYLAGCTSTVRLGTGICLLPQRNPVYAAKEAAAIDYLSGGRFDFGIGVGWLEEEFDVVNVPWPQRGKRTDDYLAVMKALWCDDPSEFHGEFYDLPACNMFPKPVQQPHPRLIFGGESKASMRRVARTGQGWYTFNRMPEDLQAPIADLEAILADAGRSRSEIEITTCPYFNAITPPMMAQYAEAGVDQITVLVFAASPDDVPAAFDGIEPLLDAARAV